jgi:RNA polymerase sigma-70 factor (ECF subfamily)
MTTAAQVVKVLFGAAQSVSRPVPATFVNTRRPKAKVDWSILIARVASDGDLQAFKTLFEFFAPRIKGFLVKSGCSAEDADELAQATMVAVWRKAALFDPSTRGAAAWIFTIARNLRTDAARRDARTRRLNRKMERDYETSGIVDEPNIVFSDHEAPSRIKSAVDQLSAEQATVIRLSFIEERSHSEIAAMLGIPLGTVKSRVRLAMKRLRELLDEAS